MLLMAALGLLLIVGLALTARWATTPYREWHPAARHPTDGAGEDPDAPPPAKHAGLRYLRGVALAVTGGFWAGALVTGPAMRLIMRLLAATAGDDAQGRVTEADEVVGDIAFEGTFGLYVFGGILPGLLSGAIYVAIRRWLPAGWLGGVAFGVLHLVVAATRVDPLRPENVDFDLVGPGWLAALTFALATIAHGVAVVALVNRFSATFPPAGAGWRVRARAFAPAVAPALFLVPALFLLVPIGIGLVVAVAVLRVDGAARLARSRGLHLAGRVALAALALVCLPGAAVALIDVMLR